MSDVQNTTSTTAPATETPATEPVITSQPETTTSTTEAPQPVESSTETPAVAESKPVDSTPVTEEATPAAEEKKEESAPAEKVVEPISQGQLGYKGPGLLKSLIPSKKEFWLSDDAVSPQGMNSFMRGEKPEVANPIVAWASQTGKGLLYFNKKGNTVRKSPESVLALYDATDLKKQSPHEIAFKLNGHEHVLKASSDNERDGWYQSIEKSMELGKATKEEVRESEGYKSEMEKLNKPNIPTPAAAAVKTPKKSTEVEKPDAQRKVSDAEDEAGKKDKKSRSTSRGLVDRLKGKKEETETKKEEKKTEKEEKKEAEKEDSNATEAATVGAVGVGAAGVGAAAATPESSAEEKKVEPVEKPEEKVEEKQPKQNKRGSIFGRIGGFGGVKSPSKEKDQKDAELKPEVPPKDDAAPQIPAPATETPAIQPAVVAVEPEAPADTTENKPGEVKTEDKKEEVATPNKEKSKFLSGLSFMKRDRSVSPSAVKKEEPAKTEPVKTETEAPKEEVVEPTKPEEATTETPAVATLPETSDKAAEPTEEVTKDAPKEEKTETTPNKRNSVFGNLGRRASKAFKGMQGPKKENTVPKTEKKEGETAEAITTDKPLVNGENKTEEAKAEEPVSSIGDVVPEAIDAGKPQSQAPPTVAASA